jgi:peptide-methionine (S)-S-oxide reductase
MRHPTTGATLVTRPAHATGRAAARTNACRAAPFGAALLSLLVLLAVAGCGSGQASTAATCATQATELTGSAATAAAGELTGRTEIATFAAGCFWGVEAHFATVPGVVDVVVGYTGGSTADPTYEEVCSHTTGHAEAVRVQFDPDVVSYEGLVESFFAMHDPTTEDRQGPDVGSQYRSAIFFHTPRQEAIATDVLERLERAGAYDDPIATEITPSGPFYRAEDYHQDYFPQ